MTQGGGARVALHGGPAAGFDQPFEMLQDCHGRVERMLRLLQRLRTHLQAVGCDEQARQAASDLIRYFDRAAPAHHEDEERHVFPPLLAAGTLVDVVARLQQEHRAMAELWPGVRDVLQRAAVGPWHGFDGDEEARLEEFARLHDWHLAAENELVFPAAAMALDSEALAAMGAEMARRRGVDRAP